MKKVVEFISVQVEEGNLLDDGRVKMIIILKYIMIRIEDNIYKFVQFMRQLILIFDKVILVMYNNIMVEYEVVKDMFNKVVEFFRYQLSESIKYLVKMKKIKLIN